MSMLLKVLFCRNNDWTGERWRWRGLRGSFSLFRFVVWEMIKRNSGKATVCLTTKCGGGVRMALLANFFLLAFWLIFLDPVGNFLPIQGKLLSISNLLFRLKYFQKTLFCPTTTYLGLCSSDHPCMKILFRAGCLRPGVIYAEKNWGS